VPVLAVLMQRLSEENRCQQEELESKDGVFHASGIVKWLVDKDGPMGEDNNDVLDWDGNNNK